MTVATITAAIRQQLVSTVSTLTETQRYEQRRTIILSLYDNDDPIDDPAQPYADLLTDVLHMAERIGLDITELLSRATRMQRMEREEWGSADD